MKTKRVFCLILVLMIFFSVLPQGTGIVKADDDVTLPEVEISTSYPVWVGNVQVNDNNKNDILGDGGKAKYDPSTKTLTLNNPIIRTAYDTYYQICSKDIDLTVKGSADLDDHYGGITVNNGTLILNADISAAGPFEAIYAENGIRITGGTVTTYSGSAGISCPELITITGGTVNARGNLFGIYAKNVMIQGGTVNATGDNGVGIQIDGGELTLSSGTTNAVGKEYGVYLDNGALCISGSISSFTAKGDQKAVETTEYGYIDLDDRLSVQKPSKGRNTGTQFVDDNGNIATEVKIVRYGEWKHNSNGWWYLNADGTYPVNQWQKINGQWYHFDAKGYMQTGWIKVGGSWYFLNSNGAMAVGWKKLGNIWYYLNSSGAMVTGWQKISGHWYYFNSSGAMQLGWQKINYQWYYFNSSGAMVIGWQKINTVWYYFNISGVMQTGWQKINNKWYYFISSGSMVTGKQTINGKEYWFDENGVWQG